MKKGWAWKPLGEVCKTGSGGTPLSSRKEYYDGGNIPWLVSGEVAQGNVREAKNFITKAGLENSAAKIFPKDTVLVAMYGATAGQVGILRFEAATNQAICGILPNDKFVPEFLFYFLLAKKDELVAQATGNAQPNISQIKIKNTEVPVPPLAEQQRIVGLLDEAFEGLAIAKANAEKNLKNARALFESHLQSVFTQRGPGWVEKSLGDICVVDWGNTDLTKSSYVEDGKFLAVSAAGCDGRIGHKEHAKHTPVLSAIGAQCGRMFLPEEDFTAIKNTITLTPRDGNCAGKFLYRLLTHVELPKRGAAQPFIAKGDILKFQIVVPEDSSAQLRIVDSLDDLEEETQRLARLYERKLAALEALKTSLLHQAFSGNL